MQCVCHLPTAARAEAGLPLPTWHPLPVMKHPSPFMIHIVHAYPKANGFQGWQRPWLAASVSSPCTAVRRSTAAACRGPQRGLDHLCSCAEDGCRAGRPVLLLLLREPAVLQPSGLAAKAAGSVCAAGRCFNEVMAAPEADREFATKTETLLSALKDWMHTVNELSWS
jgi:hypothetical protein